MTWRRRGEPTDYPFAVLAAPAVLLFVPFYTSLVAILLCSVLTPDQRQVVSLPVTFAQYWTVLTDTHYLTTYWVTLKLSGIVTVACLLLGFPIAYTIVRTPSPWVRYVLIVAVIQPFFTNVLVRVFAWTTILAREGLVNTVLNTLGVLERPQSFLRTELAVVLGLTYFLMPFAVLTLTGVLHRINPQLEHAAQTLGANEAQVFVRVLLPLSLPGIVAASLITYSLSASAFAVPLLLGGDFVKMVANLIYDQLTFAVNVPRAAALATILLVGSIVLALGYQRLLSDHGAADGRA